MKANEDPDRVAGPGERWYDPPEIPESVWREAADVVSGRFFRRATPEECVRGFPHVAALLDAFFDDPWEYLDRIRGSIHAEVADRYAPDIGYAMLEALDLLARDLCEREPYRRQVADVARSMMEDKEVSD